MLKKHRVGLARLLRDAVADAKKLQKMPGFVLDMNTFCCVSKGICHVCLGGAYGLLHMKQPKVSYLTWSTEASKAASVVDLLRLGRITSAASRLYGGSHSRDHRVMRATELIVDNLRRQRRTGGERVGRASWHTYLQAARVLEEP